MTRKDKRSGCLCKKKEIIIQIGSDRVYFFMLNSANILTFIIYRDAILFKNCRELFLKVDTVAV